MGEAVVRVTGLRNPCQQINVFRDGLLKLVLTTDEAGAVLRKCGVMGVVERAGRVHAGQRIDVQPGPGPHAPLVPV